MSNATTTLSGSIAAGGGRASVIRIPVRNAISHLSGGDLGGPSTISAQGGTLAQRGPTSTAPPLVRKASPPPLRVVSGAGYDEPSEVAEREGSVMTLGGGGGGNGEGSGDSLVRVKPAATERSDVTGLHTTISRVSTLHPSGTKRKAPKQPTTAAAADGGDGCECGCVSQPVVGAAKDTPPKRPAVVGMQDAPMPPPSQHAKCVQCGGLSRMGRVADNVVAARCGGQGADPAVPCGHAVAVEEDKVVVDKQELIKLLGMVKELKGGDVEGWLQTLGANHD